MEWLRTDHRNNDTTTATEAKNWRLRVMLRLAEIRREDKD